MHIKKGMAAIAFGFCAMMATAQTSKAPDNWFNKDLAKDGVAGLSTEEAYAKLKALGKKGKTVIVAVLDSGVDYKHEDLKDVMWVNPGEIAGNGIDDDKNGYVDDIHGWNFIGGKNGENVSHDTYELTREYARLGKKYAGKEAGSDKKEYAYWLNIKAAFEEKRGDMEGEKKLVDDYFAKAEKALAQGAEALGKTSIGNDDLKAIKDLNRKDLKETIATLEKVMAQGINSETFAERKAEAMEYYGGGLEYGLNPNYNPRTIVGDNYEDLTNRFYGNNDVQGPDAMHGTHVAGIIAAKRNNGIGMNGVADNVRIMSVRCVPDGDERDKDVANAIRYAVDNGASIINMSFGKGYSPNKDYVDAAMRYAVEHDVLLVHAAGNDSENNDTDPNFPNDKYAKKGGLFKPKKVNTWMEIGALNWKPAEKRTASFSNYGKDNVDIFSPGVAIYATVPGNEYQSLQGTSMASPAAAGVAAILRSYFPELSAKQVKSVMMDACAKQEGKVTKPGSTDLVSFSDLCVTGGIVSASKSVDAATKVKGKKVKAAKWRMAAEAADKATVVRP